MTGYYKINTMLKRKDWFSTKTLKIIHTEKVYCDNGQINGELCFFNNFIYCDDTDIIVDDNHILNINCMNSIHSDHIIKDRECLKMDIKMERINKLKNVI